jgi:hypothetical protein
MFFVLAAALVKNPNPPTGLPKILSEDGRRLMNEREIKLVSEKKANG